jgi:hypothetical protein
VVPTSNNYRNNVYLKFEFGHAALLRRHSRNLNAALN